MRDHTIPTMAEGGTGARTGTWRRRRSVVAATALALLASGCWWTQPGAGPGRTSANLAGELTSETVGALTHRWSVAALGAGREPVVVDGLVVFLADARTLTAVDVHTGAPAWSRPVPGTDLGLEPGSPAVADGVVDLTLHEPRATCSPGEPCAQPGNAGGIVRFDLRTGAAVPGEPPYSSGRASEGSPVLGGAYSASRWWEPAVPAVPAPGSPGRAPVLRHTRVFRHADGASWDLPGSDVDVAIDEALGHLYGATGTTLWAADLTCATPPCEPRWSVDLGMAVREWPVVERGAVYAVVAPPSSQEQTVPAELVVLDATTGARRWSASLGTHALGAPAVADGRAYVARSGILQVFAPCGAPTCPPVWTSIPPPGPTGHPFVTSPPTLAGDLVYVDSTTYGPRRARTGLGVYPAAGCGAPTCAPLLATEQHEDAYGGTRPVVAGGTALYVTSTIRAYRVPD